MSDRIRRKPIIIWNGLLVFLSFASMTVVVFCDLNVYYFVIAVMANGFSGTFYTFNFNALMSDVTSENKQRSFLMTVFHALFDLTYFMKRKLVMEMPVITKFTNLIVYS